MLEAIYPLSYVFAAIRVNVGSFAVFFVITVIAFVATAVLPGIDAESVHHPGLKFAFEVAAISPTKNALAGHLVSDPIPGVSGAI